MGLAVFRSDLTADKKRKVVEVREEWSEAVRAGAANIVPHPNSETAELGRVVLYRGSKRTFGMVGRVHPFIHGGGHPSMLEGQDILIGRLCLGAIKPVPEIGPKILQGSPTFFGGPVATEEVRLIFGRDGQSSPLLGIPLPFSFRYWDLIEQAVKSRAELWELIVEGKRAPAVKECLIITVLPIGEEDKIVSIAGLRPAGTRALDFVLRNRRLLERLERSTRQFVGWQLFAEVVAKDAETPISLHDEVIVREIRGVDFDSVRYSTLSRLLLDKEAVIDDQELRLAESMTANLDSPREKSRLGKETSPSKSATIRSPASQRSGERARTAAPSKEPARMPSQPDSERTTSSSGSEGPGASVVDSLDLKDLLAFADATLKTPMDVEDLLERRRRNYDAAWEKYENSVRR